jgi:hypothetical protein
MEELARIQCLGFALSDWHSTGLMIFRAAHHFSLILTHSYGAVVSLVRSITQAMIGGLCAYNRDKLSMILPGYFLTQKIHVLTGSLPKALAMYVVHYLAQGHGQLKTTFIDPSFGNSHWEHASGLVHMQWVGN